MQASRTNLFLRDDTFFGICEGLGEDLRLPPNLLRIAFALGLFWNPVVVLGIYAGLGLLVLTSRLLVREPRPVTLPLSEPVEVFAEPAADEQREAENLPIAA